MEKSPKIIRNIKLNKSPLFQSYKFINKISAMKALSEKIILNRNQFIKNNPLFKERIISYYEKSFRKRKCY